MACWSKGMAGGYAGYQSIESTADKHLSEVEGRGLRQRKTVSFNNP
jgi:hypothetical protein